MKNTGKDNFKMQSQTRDMFTKMHSKEFVSKKFMIEKLSKMKGKFKRKEKFTSISKYHNI